LRVARDGSLQKQKEQNTMVDKNIFIAGLFGVAALAIIATIYFKKTTEQNISSRELLARNVFFGTLIIFIDLMWCVPVSKPIAPNFIIPYMVPLAFILTYIGYQFLDYHFSRAIGGLIILTASFLLTQVWAFDKPEGSLLAMVFTLLTYLFGIIGLFISGKPYLLRDWFRKCASSPRIKTVTGVYFITYAVISTALAVTTL